MVRQISLLIHFGVIWEGSCSWDESFLPSRRDVMLALAVPTGHTFVLKA
jgi:hypothetical protein